MKLLTSYTILLIPIMIVFSCTNPSSQTQSVKKKSDSIKTKPPSSFSDTIIINSPSAIFYNPDSEQLEKIKATTDSLVFKSMEHDCFFQMRNSRNVLTSSYPKIAIREVINARWLLFKQGNGQQKIIDLNTNNDPCGIYLFRPGKEPQLIDMTNVETELGFYFSK